ncbi:MAG: transporter [Burkholderiales bacterium]
MTRSSLCSLPRTASFSAVTALILLGVSGSALASEGYKTRQSPVGAFGGEIAAPGDNDGFFGTAIMTMVSINKVADGNGDDITLPAGTVALPTRTTNAALPPDGTYKLNVPAGAIAFKQTQTQVNLLGGYLTESTYNGGRMAFAVNLPLILISRTVSATQPSGTVSPVPAAPLPSTAIGAVNAIAQAANQRVQNGVAGFNNINNLNVSGLGDAELSAVWVRHDGQLKVAAGASLFVPTGQYDKNRGPNPGFGNFYTLRPGVALTYALNPDKTASGWDSGVTVAGRLSYGINTSNLETDYRSGDFVYTELGVVKVSGDWAFGANLLAIQQTTDDSGSGTVTDKGLGPVNAAARYKNYGFGPFLSYKLPGKDAGFNLHYTRNFGSENAQVVEALQVRFIKAW